MQKRDNPYTPGAGRKPPNLAGRDRDLEGFQSLIERLGAGGYERSLIYRCSQLKPRAGFASTSTPRCLRSCADNS